jgi:hypothetical protein
VYSAIVATTVFFGGMVLTGRMEPFFADVI